MVFSLFKKKPEAPDPVIPVSRIAKAASVEESFLQPPPPPPESEPVASEPAPAPEAIITPPRRREPEPETAPPEPVAAQAEPEETMRPYHKIPPEFWAGEFGPYLKQDLGLSPKDEWNIIAQHGSRNQ